MRSFRAASSILSPSWMSMARLTFPSRLELNRLEGSFNSAHLAWSFHIQLQLSHLLLWLSVTCSLRSLDPFDCRKAGRCAVVVIYRLNPVRFDGDDIPSIAGG